jgi:hypothetical protein
LPDFCDYYGVMANYLPARKAQAILGVTLRTLIRWAEAGKIETIKTPGGQNRYNVESVFKPTDDTQESITKEILRLIETIDCSKCKKRIRKSLE